ncbi:hypothetical protein GmHk_07G020270 [Glycine max]|nr:hypothetical protein GmHk_07G020270 [Glycine max]
MNSYSSTASNKIRNPIIGRPLILQFKAAFHCDKDIIQIPAFYHQQWQPDYSEFVQFKYDGTTYEIRQRQHRGKCYFADGLTRFRKELEIYESITIKFLASDHFSIFNLHFTPTIDQQTCGRPRCSSRKYIWTLAITQCMLDVPYPLQLPPSITSCLIHCDQHMTILRRFGPPLQWPIVVIDAGIGDKYVVQPWYQFLEESNFSDDD